MEEKIKKNQIISNNIFRYFIRIQFPDIKDQLTNDDLDALNEGFNEYLNKIPEEKRNNFLPNKETDLIVNITNPLYFNGFHPAFVLHFTEFIKTEQMRIELEENKSENKN